MLVFLAFRNHFYREFCAGLLLVNSSCMHHLCMPDRLRAPVVRKVPQRFRVGRNRSGREPYLCQRWEQEQCFSVFRFLKIEMTVGANCLRCRNCLTCEHYSCLHFYHDCFLIHLSYGCLQAKLPAWWGRKAGTKSTTPSACSACIEWNQRRVQLLKFFLFLPLCVSDKLLCSARSCASIQIFQTILITVFPTRLFSF